VPVAFYAIAAVMIMLALGALIHPLIRQSRAQARSRNMLATIVAIAALLPAAAIGLYARLGTPAAMNGTIATVTTGADVRQRDIRKWLDTAHAYDASRQAAQAREAYARVLNLDAQNTVAMVGWVEADMAQQTDYAVDAAARRMLEQAIALEPDNQRALWLWGIGQFQQGDYAAASVTWRHLLQLLDHGSGLAQSVTRQIAIADAKADPSGSRDTAPR